MSPVALGVAEEEGRVEDQRHDVREVRVGAQEDLRLRGAGELLGTRQSGMPEFHLADLVAHADLIQIARDDARLVLEMDPELVSERGLALRVLLYLFEKDAVVKTIRSG